jgi:predicted transcriptional regulator
MKDVKKNSAVEKWGSSLASTGFTILPNQLLTYNSKAAEEEKISPSEFFVLCQLLLHWWSARDMPFPSKSTISERTGLSSRQVQRTLGSLEKKGLLKRVARFGKANAGRMSNAYDLSSLVRTLDALASKKSDTEGDANEIRGQSRSSDPAQSE